MQRECISVAKRRSDRRKTRGLTSNKPLIFDEKYNGTLDQYLDISLSEEEVQNLTAEYGQRVRSIQEEFLRLTKLSPLDIQFLMLAVVLQCLRQYLITPFKDRTHHEFTKKEDKKVEKNFYDKVTDNGLASGKQGGYYFRKLNDIILKGVPYDTIKGGFELGLSGVNHRYKTLGHDPILGWIFGTFNIMTNTLTTNNFASYHIRNTTNANNVSAPGIYSKAENDKIVQAVIDRMQREPVALAAALLKQGIHLRSDINTVKSLPIPVIETISPKLAAELSKYGLDAANGIKIGEQASYSIVINSIIAMIHKLFYDETLYFSENIYKVKTKKILMYSNAIATSSNVLYVLLSNDLKKLDVGGIFVTMYRIITDEKYITKVMDEFVNGEVSKIYEKELKDTDNELNRLLKSYGY